MIGRWWRLRVVAVAVLVPRTSWALGPVDLGVSALLVGGYNALDTSTPASFTAGNEATSYPGFGGLTAGGGLAFELRVLGLVGLEIDGVVSRDFGRGEVRPGLDET